VEIAPTAVWAARDAAVKLNGYKAHSNAAWEGCPWSFFALLVVYSVQYPPSSERHRCALRDQRVPEPCWFVVDSTALSLSLVGSFVSNKLGPSSTTLIPSTSQQVHESNPTAVIFVIVHIVVAFVINQSNSGIPVSVRRTPR